MKLGRICVFCGSSAGADPAYRAAAVALGGLLARRGLGLVFGGGHVGLMGAVADAAMAAGGQAVGILPRGLQVRELGHEGLTELHIVGSMHERKALMAELSDGFVALPGGMGTLEETAEALTWAQLGIHQKPVGLLNVKGYWDPLALFLDHAVAQGFLRPEHRWLCLVEREPEALLDRMASWEPPPLRRWMSRDEA
jgi:uncharacterized protein (TIGR00730 family)